MSSIGERTSVVESKQVKRIKQEFKNAHYIVKCTRNKGMFRVPLMMVTEYKGFTVLAKSELHLSQEYSAPVHIQEDIKLFEIKTRISRDLFES